MPSLKRKPAAAGAAAVSRPVKRAKVEKGKAPTVVDEPMKPAQIAKIIEESTPWSASRRPAKKSNAALHVISWNVNGLRALMKASPNALKDLLAQEKPDVVFLQETKLQQSDVDGIKAMCVPSGWGSHWECSGPPSALGYAGVAALWRPGLAPKVTAGVGLPQADSEGRCVILELPSFFCVGSYVPNSGDGLKRLDFRIRAWQPAIAKLIARLQAKKPVIYCGDLNVCHKELDLWGNHTANTKGPGYTPEERIAMSNLLQGCNLVDTFRAKHPGCRGFSYWSYRFNGRAKNNGWRLDYHLVSRKLENRVHDAYILDAVRGSDHCPVGVVLA